MCIDNPFRVQRILVNIFPGLSLRSNPGLKLANAFGVFWSISISVFWSISIGVFISILTEALLRNLLGGMVIPKTE